MKDKKKERIRGILRVLMVFVAVLLLVVALVIPVTNNFIAAGVKNELEALPLPANTRVEDGVSAAGNLLGHGRGVQYFGGVLLHSDLSLDQLQKHYAAYGCIVQKQEGTPVCPAGRTLKGADLSFPAVKGDGWYLVYKWGRIPAAIWDVLNLDFRA